VPTDEIIQAPKTRRVHLRFPLATELKYQVVRRGGGAKIRGRGKAEDISSKALAFRADGHLECGMRLRVSLAWPAKLDDQCKLRLAFEGTVLRTRGNLVVLAIQRPEFRTAGRITAARQELPTVAQDI
jgi:hypothetical protein